MKYIIMFLVSVNVWASENCQVDTMESRATKKTVITTDVPKYLEGAVIIVRLADGRATTVPAEKFKVVPRQRQALVTEVTTSTLKVCQDHNNHRVSLHAGKGPQGGLDRDNSQAPNVVKVESQFGAVGGVQYQYRFDNSHFSASGQLQTNETGLVGIGYDF